MATTDKAFHSAPAKNWFSIRHVKGLGLLLLLLIMFFYRLGSYPLFDLDEPRYAEAAREMLENGNWITPYFNYELRFDKPILFYWLIALAYQLFGVSEFAARFFSAVTATLTVGAVYAFGRHWVSSRFGFFAAVMLATSIMFAGLARMSITDMTLSFFMTATTLCLFMAAHRDLRWWLAAGVFAGLGVLTKGPVALVVPGAILVLYALAIGGFKRVLLNRWLPLALLVCLMIALPWYVAAYLQNGLIFLDMLFLHNVTRFSDTVSGHKQPIFFYAIVLPVGFLPWTVYLPAAIRHLWLEFKAHHRAHVRSVEMRYLIPLFSAVWIAFVFLFFTFSNTKLLTYILPLFPALALFLAATWEREGFRAQDTASQSSRWFTVPAWLLVVAAVIAGGIFIFNMDALLPREARGIEGNGANVIAVALLVLGTLLAALLVCRRNMAPALVAQAATVTLVGMVAIHGILPNISRATQGTMLEYLAKTGGEPLMLYELQRPSLTFYGQRRVPRYVEERHAQMTAELARNPRTFVITKNKYLDDFNRAVPAAMRVQILAKDSVYSLLSVSQAP